jgi:hypothetical protein
LYVFYLDVAKVDVKVVHAASRNGKLMQAEAVPLRRVRAVRTEQHGRAGSKTSVQR